MIELNSIHQKTLADIFTDPAKPNVRWDSVKTLFIACGAEIAEGRGSRVRVMLNGMAAVFHKPHPRPEVDKGALKSIRRFLAEAGVKHGTHDET